MSISYPLTIPVPIRTFSLGYHSVVGVTIAPHSLKSKKFQQDGAVWMLSLTFHSMSANPGETGSENPRLLQRFLVALDGGIGSFMFGDPGFVAPAGVGTGTPLVNGAGQSGYSLNVKGATTSTTNWLKAGDRLQIGTDYYMNMNDVNSDGSGNCTLEIRPPLRSAYANNTPIILMNPKGKFRLQGQEVGWTSSAPQLYDHDTVQAVEDI